MNESKIINVTQPFLPPLKEFQPYLERIWENKWLTNNGEFHQQLEKELCEYLGVPFISLFANGTLALLTALQILDIKGEVITTPYTFVATSHALIWNNLTPIFVDIDPIYGNLDPDKIEEAITDKTTAILPVHVYGNPCDTEKIQAIADKHNLKVIYDAAHAFGVKQNGKSILNAGDLSILSFHATKVFNTFEGGAIVCHNAETKQRIDDLKNFGFRDEVTVVAVGINGKMNEMQAAMGLMQLSHIENSINKRKIISEYYYLQLENMIEIRCLKPNINTYWNYAYLPIFIQSNSKINRDKLYNRLKESKIYGRRYFYPLVSNIPIYNDLVSSDYTNLINANSLSNQVICLPIYPELLYADVDRIVEVIKKSV